MNTITILPLVPIDDTTWTAYELPDRVRKSISFQMESLGILHWSLDGGTSSYKAVGTGETLHGNFSKRTIYFKADVGADNVQIRTQDTYEG